LPKSRKGTVNSWLWAAKKRDAFRLARANHRLVGANHRLAAANHRLARANDNITWADNKEKH